jgi:hypothetical protein
MSSNSSKSNISIDIPRKIEYNLRLEEQNFKKSNDYDYEQTIKSFETMDRLSIHKKKLLKPIKKQNKIWKRNLERCYIQREEIIENQKSKIEEKMRRRSVKVKELLSLNESIKSQEKQRRIEQNQKSREKALKKLEEFYVKEEEGRLITETKVIKKLQQRTARQAEEIEKIRKKFHERNKSSELRYEKNFTNLNEEKKIKDKKDAEQKFENFMKWYFFFQGEKKKKKEKKDKKNIIKQRCLENQQNLEEQLEKQRLETEMNLNQAEKKRRELAEKQHLELAKKIEQHNYKAQQNARRKQKLIAENKSYNKEIMKVQTQRILEGYEREKRSDLNKCNIQ